MCSLNKETRKCDFLQQQQDKVKMKKQHNTKEGEMPNFNMYVFTRFHSDHLHFHLHLGKFIVVFDTMNSK